MKHLCAILLSLLLGLVPCAEAAYNFGTVASFMNAGSTYITASLPMTVGGWVNLTGYESGNEEILLVSGRSGSGGWKFHASCGAVCTCGGNDMHFTKIAVADVCSTTVVPLNAWNFVAAVVSSTTVHFVLISAAGVVTTQNISNSNTIATPTSPVTQVAGSTTNSMIKGNAANIAIWTGVGLSDAELKAYAFQGVSAIRKPLHCWLLFNTSATTQAQGDLCAGNAAFLATGSNGPPTTAPHSPTGRSFVRH